MLIRQIVTLLLLATTGLVYVDSVEARPASTWRTRNTGLSSRGECTRRAFRAMKAARLDYKSSGNLGVYGKNGQAATYIICLENGSIAAIFCATDESSSAPICDLLTRYMEP